MRWMILALPMLLLACSAPAGAGEPTEMEVAGQLAARCGYAQIGHDEEGRVTGLLFRTGKAYWEPPEWLGKKVREVVAEKDAKRPQLTDADLPMLGKLPNLKFLRLDGMLITGKGYWSLKELKQLEYLGLYAIDRKEMGDKVDPTCILVANELPNLRRFDYKHNFRIRRVPADKLKGTEKIEYLHLDNAGSRSSIVPFILACPNLKRLELHRTGIMPKDLAKIVAANKKLTDIRIRPQNDRGLQPSDLKLLTALPALETLCFGGQYNRMTFDGENDLAHISRIKTLKSIVAPARKREDPVFVKWVEGLKGVEVKFGYY
jgi:hypothetical protein